MGQAPKEEVLRPVRSSIRPYVEILLFGVLRRKSQRERGCYVREICQLCGLLYGLRSPIGDDREVSNGYCCECAGMMGKQCEKESSQEPVKEPQELNK
jgi:hypothetical protein